VLNNVNELFKSVSTVCKMSCDNLMKSLDYNLNDKSSENFESLVAMLRAINILNSMGFSDIIPVKLNNKKHCDLLANYKDEICVIEVFCSTEKAKRLYSDIANLRSSKISYNLTTYYLLRAKEKKPQLDCSASFYSAKKKILILVLNSYPSIALDTRPEYEEMLKNIYYALNWGVDYHFGLFTGMTTLGIGSDDAIYPPF
jgi:hypothetical protein